MAEEPPIAVEGEGEEEEEEEEERREPSAATKSRREKRKERKKEKRRQKRREAAEREREEDERKRNDPEEQRRVREMEEADRVRMERDRLLFEEREREWFVERERKLKEQEEERRRLNVLEQEKEVEEVGRESSGLEMENKNECSNDDEDWEYVEEGPAEIIWQGNEIIVRKKKVRVPKSRTAQQSGKQDADRPTSNPLPPQSEAFAEYKNVSAQEILETVAQQVPNFGTEQDKAHCPFHLKTGACRFGQRCSRVHFYPDKACTLLIKNMYNGPGLAWEQDEGLEYTDEEVEHCYEEFYEDVHTEFLKYGEIVNFKVCKNGSSHLRGNVYVHYKTVESAVLAYHSISGRYFAGKQVKSEFVNVTKWKVAICGEYMKSRLKTCSRGIACNFIHCFRNPGGDYEWADWDKPPPRYWMKRMAALFGYPVQSDYDQQMEQEDSEVARMPRKIMADMNRRSKRSRSRSRDDGHHSKRSRSRSVDHSIHSYGRGSDSEDDVRGSTHRKRHNSVRNEKLSEEKAALKKEHCHNKSRVVGSVFDEDRSDADSDGKNRHSHHEHARESSKHRSNVLEESHYGDGNSRRRSKSKSYNGTDTDSGSHGYQSDGERNEEHSYSHKEQSSRPYGITKSDNSIGDHRSQACSVGSDVEWSTGRNGKINRKRNRHSRHVDDEDDLMDRDEERHQNHRSNRYSEHRHSYKRNRIRHHESELSNDEGGVDRKSKEKSHHRDYETGTSRMNNDSRRHSIRHSSDGESRIDVQDRWVPGSPDP